MTQLTLDVTWTQCSVEELSSQETASSFVIAQAVNPCIKPDFDSSHKLFGIHQKAPSWAFFSLPPELAQSAQRCFHHGKILKSGAMSLELTLEMLQNNQPSHPQQVLLRCLHQLLELNMISEELYRNIFKFTKS
jgi:hypothetical protein